MTQLHDSPQRHRDPASTQQVMTRHNGLTFYGLAAASFLETAIPLHANALLHAFAADADVQRWIERAWWPVKSAHARDIRAYVEATWPEFDWSAAYADFYDAYHPVAGGERGEEGRTRTALVHSTGAAQAAAFYRCLSTAADDAALRALLQRMSADESAHFAAFRRIFVRFEERHRLGLLATYRTIVASATRARDVDVQLAFLRLGSAYWYGGMPFPEIDYRDFIARMGAVVRRHQPLGAMERFLFRPWWQPQHLPAADATMRPRAARHPATARCALRARSAAL